VIAFVRGVVAEIGLSSAVIEVGGIGLDVQCTPQTLSQLRVGSSAVVPTSMVVREDSLTLFGFATDDEKQSFVLLQTASGVGPKVAQAMLAVLTPEEIRRAITTDDVKALTRVPGVGLKGAQRIILELRDRIGAPTSASHALPGRSTAALAWQTQVHAGLVGLGWSAKEADRAVSAVADEAATMSTPDVGKLLRLALRTLSAS
jgi:Holliday junction DNA helicase RuvA